MPGAATLAGRSIFGHYRYVKAIMTWLCRRHAVRRVSLRARTRRQSPHHYRLYLGLVDFVSVMKLPMSAPLPDDTARSAIDGATHY
jgi:hypothetical protein